MSWLKDVFKSKKKNFAAGDTNSKEFAIHIIKQLKDRHSPAIINFKGSGDQFISMIIDIDEKSNRLTFDEFSPQEGHERASKGEPFKVTASDHGIAIIFDSKVIKTTKEDGLTVYKTVIPEKIEYAQRREAFRVKLNIASQIPIKFSHNSLNIDKAKIVDISFSGVRIEILEQNLSERISQGTILEPVLFTLKGNERINCKLMVKRSFFDDRNNKTTIAGALLDLDQSGQRVLNQSVIELERLERKRELGEND